MPRADALARGLVELGRDLEHLLGRVIRRESRGMAGEIVDLAAFGQAVDHLEVTRRITRQRLLAFAQMPNIFL